ncbi:MAG: hypothetical protein M3Y35_09190 [Actinomycetota bacterium]|nr:hypothetical protein [Actinomycetota bacterium]
MSLTNNGGATITFNGNLALTTGTNAAFTATGGGTVTVTGANNTLATTTGTALLVANTTIGATGLKFTSISAGTGSGSAGDGIVLNNTGSTGGLTVTGNGTTASSGGTIQHKTGTDGDTANGIGIYLNSTASVSLNWMQLNDFDNFALFGSSVSGFALNNSVVNGTNGTNGAMPYDEASVWFSQLAGAATLTGDTISGGRQDNVHVQNSSGTLSNLTIADPNCAIQNNSTSTDGNAGITILASLTANVTTTISNCQFQGNRSDTIHTDAADTSTLNVTISGNTIVAGTGVNNQGNLGMEVTASQSAQVTFAVTNNKVGTPDGTTQQPLMNTGINVFGSATSRLSGTVTNNTVINGGNTCPNSTPPPTTIGCSGTGIRIYNSESSILNAKVDSNNVSNVALDYGIDVTNNGSGTASSTGNIQVAVTNNTVSVLSTAIDDIHIRGRRDTTSCTRISGNTTTIIGGTGPFGLDVSQAQTAIFKLEGDTGQTATANLAANNPGATPQTTSGTITVVPSGTCTGIPA